ncbi:MAG: hypothetical protein Q4E53_09620, partial [Eubacteriales bacterium]|nr:hypothetical protein [Eubacteriales bacterium]
SGSTLRIVKPGSNQTYASQLNTSKTFSVTLDKAGEKPQADDFECHILHKDSCDSSSSTSVSSESIKVKNVEEVSDGTYSLEFEFTPNDTGFFDFNIKYKDEDEDDVGLMIYDTAILEKLEKNYEDTVKETYTSYMNKVKKEVEKIKDDTAEDADYQVLVKDLQKDPSLIINGILDVGSLSGFDQLSTAEKNELTACAYEAYARAMRKTCIEFNAIKDNDKAESEIVNKIIKYINEGNVVNNHWTKLDSGYNQNGSLHSVSAKWNLNFNNGTITVRDDSTNKQYTFSATSDDIYDCVANYLDELKKLEISAIENAKAKCLEDFQNLIDWNFIAEGKDILDNANRNWANALADWMSKHGIDHLIDNLKTYKAYYENSQKIFNAFKTGTTVILDKDATSGEKIASLHNICQLEFNSADCGNYADKIYNKIVDAEKKSKDYLEEYLKTGTIKDLEPNTLWDKFKNGFTKNEVKCPVSVSVLNASGTEVGYVGDDDIWYNDDIMIKEDGDTKIIYTPFGESYSFVVTGTDVGTVSYTAEQFQNGSSVGHRVNAYDIPIVTNTVINIWIPSGSITSNRDVSVTSQGNTIETALVNNASAMVDISLNNNSSCGKVYGGGSYVIGDVVTIKVIPEEGYVFDGWYEGDILVDWSREYQFEARNSKTLTAKYHKKLTEEEISAITEKVIEKIESTEPHTHVWDDGVITTPATCRLEGVKTYTCSCGETNTEKIPATGHSWDDGVITTPPTTTTTGVKTYTCSVCKVKKMEGVDKLPTEGSVTPTPVANVITASDITRIYSTGAQSFNIGASCKGGAKLTYTSNNSNIAVNSVGQVSVKAKYMGEAVITITSSATAQYKAAMKQITVTVTPKKTTISKATSPKKKTLKVTWKKNATASGYQVYVSASKTFTRNTIACTVKGQKKLSATATKLKSKKKYYAKVRAYKTVSGKKIYGPWSVVKACKVK